MKDNEKDKVGKGYEVMEEFYQQLDESLEALEEKEKNVRFAFYLLIQKCEQKACFTWGNGGETDLNHFLSGLSLVLADIVVLDGASIDDIFDYIRTATENSILKVKNMAKEETERKFHLSRDEKHGNTHNL